MTENKKQDNEETSAKEETVTEDPFDGGKVTQIDVSSVPVPEDFEDDGEDLPDNFFDDFSNHDFMAGLDVVDDWIEEDDLIEEPVKEVEKQKKSKRSSSRHKSPQKPRDHRQDYRRRYSPERRSRDRYRRRSRSRNRRSRSRQYDKSNKNEKKENVEIDRRRDPEKTKRDIQRDKIRCAKDQEARVFQEQLKVAETGLVPPGTELDVVMTAEKFKSDGKVKEDKPKEEKGKVERVEKRKIEEPKKYPAWRLRERSYSPKRRRRDSRSRERRRSRHSRDVDLRYRLREKRERYLNETSPTAKNRISRSPSPFVMSPESPVRYNRAKYSRSCSPISSNSFTERLVSPRRRTKKFTFMEELEIKLRQTKQPFPSEKTYPPPLMSLQPVPAPAANPAEFFHTFQPPMQNVFPAPAMCPAPEPFHQPHLMAGDPNLIPMLPDPNQAARVTPMAQFPALSPQISTPPNFGDSSQYLYNSAQFQMQSNLTDYNSSTKAENQEFTKLFEDKKISLSDFLSVSAKPIDPSTPISIHNKIKVISRCQDALKILEDPKLVGRFFPKISQQIIDAEKRLAEKTSVNQSPLRRVAVVRFNFTVPVSKRWSNSRIISLPSTGMYLFKLSCILGLSPKVQVPEEPKKITPKPPAAMKRVNSFVQTEPMKCQICEIRSTRKFESQDTQTNTKETIDVSTQVSVEDLNKSCTTFIPRGILKNSSSVQSISHLTPAQLLAQQEHDKKEKWANKKELFPVNRNFSDTRSVPDFNFNPYSDDKPPRGLPSLLGDPPKRFPNQFTSMFQSTENRNDFMPNRNSFGNDSRNFEAPFGARRFSDAPGTSFGPWNSPAGRGNIRFGTTPPNNKFFNPRGPN